MAKKGLLAVKIVCLSVASVIGIGLTVGYNIANQYPDLIDNFLSKSDYVATEAEKECAINVAKEGTVLLKNVDNALPLKSNESNVAVFGQNSVDFVYGGSGSGSVDTAAAPNLKKALEDKTHGGLTVDENLWDFYKNGAGKPYRKSYPDSSGQGPFAVKEVPIDILRNDSNAIKTLKSNQVAIVTIGRSGGESSDLPLTSETNSHYTSNGQLYLQLDKNERDTLKYACENFTKVILIVNANNPMELGFLEETDFSNVKGVLWIGGVGQEGLYGLAEVITGKANPSGRLVDTYAYDSTSAPSYQNIGDFTIANADSKTARATKYLVYGEGIYIGYRYYETRYEDKVLNRGNPGDFDYSKSVQFPFGYGLSYSNFTYSNYAVTYVAEKDAFEVKVDVTNDANGVAGKEVVQIYAQKPYTGLVETSAVDLVGETKTPIIQPGETYTATVMVEKRDLTSYDYKTNSTYILDKGDYYLATGKNAHDALNNILAEKNIASVGGNTSLADKVLTIEAVDATTYKTSKTGFEIKNQLSDADINHYDSSFNYLSRSNWVDTLVSSASYQNHNWTAPNQLIEDLKWYRGDEVINDTSLPTTIWDSTSTHYTVNDLLKEPYSSSKWDDLVNQLSWSDASRLVRVGGYSTQPIDSIGLPKTTDKDGPSGISGTLVGGANCMAWPAEVVMASTWNDELIEEVGVHIGEDSISSQVTGWYAPGVNIHRSPYSGRNFEYFSEDGFLAGKIGAAEMRGVRSQGVMAYMKHFFLNDQETNRYGGAFFSNEQEMREISLKGFQIITEEAHPTAMMVAMNRCGSRWVGAHKGVMTNILRNEWGYEGMSITDQASVPSMYYQDMISGLWAGNDLWLNSNNKLWPLSATDETVGGLENSSVNYKTNNTVSAHIHRAAKNIIYAVVNSNAVQKYGTTQSGNVTVLPWRQIIIAGDVLFYALAAASIVWIVLPKIKTKKFEQ